MLHEFDDKTDLQLVDLLALDCYEKRGKLFSIDRKLFWELERRGVLRDTGERHIIRSPSDIPLGNFYGFLKEEHATRFCNNLNRVDYRGYKPNQVRHRSTIYTV